MYELETRENVSKMKRELQREGARRNFISKDKWTEIANKKGKKKSLRENVVLYFPSYFLPCLPRAMNRPGENQGRKIRKATFI